MIELKELIKNIYANGEIEELEKTFQRLANKFFFGGYFLVGKKRIYLLDIEFYYHEETIGTNHIHDNIMYHINGKNSNDPFPNYFQLGSFHEHSSGLDFCFENEELNYRASILIRKIRVIEENGKISTEDRPQYIPGIFLGNNDVFDDGFAIKWIDTEEIEYINFTPTVRKNVPFKTDNDNIVIKEYISVAGAYSKAYHLKKEWRYKKPLLTDISTNKVYFSEWLKKDYPIETKEIIDILDKYHISYDFLQYTNDIWARDYMPLQLDHEVYIKYKYAPDYLYGNTMHVTDSRKSLESIGIQYIESDINIDGGNLIKTPQNVLLVDKVYQENNCNTTDEKRKLRECLEKQFGYKPIILPWDKEDEFGHADGLVRYIGNNMVLLANYNEWIGGMSYYKRIKSILEHAGYKVISLQFTEGEYAITGEEYSNDDTWMYINFLHTKEVIIIPSIGIKEYDCSAKKQFETIFPKYLGKIEFVDIRNITNDLKNGGGGMNCISWNIIS